VFRWGVALEFRLVAMVLCHGYCVVVVMHIVRMFWDTRKLLDGF